VSHLTRATQLYLNMCDLDRIGLSKYDLGQDVIQTTMMSRDDHRVFLK
jgi:hypothetical protein